MLKLVQMYTYEGLEENALMHLNMKKIERKKERFKKKNKNIFLLCLGKLILLKLNHTRRRLKKNNIITLYFVILLLYLFLFLTYFYFVINSCKFLNLEKMTIFTNSPKRIFL